MSAIERTLWILRELSQHTEGYGVKELSEDLDLPQSSVHRILRVLVDEGFVVQESMSHRYSIGPEVFAMTGRSAAGRSLVEASRPHLDWLAQEINETAFATSLVGGVPVCVAISECDRPLRLFINVGQRMPFHAAASARVILAHQSEDEARRMITDEKFESFTTTTPTSADAVMALLPDIRERGYAVCTEELDRHVTALAAPVRDVDGLVTSSVTVLGPTVRMADERREAAAALVVEAGRRISAARGYAEWQTDEQ